VRMVLLTSSPLNLFGEGNGDVKIQVFVWEKICVNI
jgi:hypothetical protein